MSQYVKGEVATNQPVSFTVAGLHPYQAQAPSYVMKVPE